jgi:Tfp pilus assembly protein PilF
MSRTRRRCAGTFAAAALGLLSAAGCQHAGNVQRPEAPPGALASKTEATPKLNGKQVADVQIAQGRSLEKQGELTQAAVAYREALKRDPNRADAYLRLAILHDKEGKFKESQEFYQLALKGMPGNPDIYCNVGYSLSLQERWAEAEMNLRQAVALAPEHSRAHNNLGLVLAHQGRAAEALAEFRRAGCTEAEGQVNLAYVLTLEKHWAEARQHYERALALDASSVAAQKGLQELDAVGGIQRVSAESNADEENTPPLTNQE